MVQFKIHIPWNQLRKKINHGEIIPWNPDFFQQIPWNSNPTSWWNSPCFQTELSPCLRWSKNPRNAGWGRVAYHPPMPRGVSPATGLWTDRNASHQGVATLGNLWEIHGDSYRYFMGSSSHLYSPDAPCKDYLPTFKPQKWPSFVGKYSSTMVLIWVGFEWI